MFARSSLLHPLHRPFFLQFERSLSLSLSPFRLARPPHSDVRANIDFHPQIHINREREKETLSRKDMLQGGTKTVPTLPKVAQKEPACSTLLHEEETGNFL